MESPSAVTDNGHDANPGQIHKQVGAKGKKIVSACLRCSHTQQSVHYVMLTKCPFSSASNSCQEMRCFMKSKSRTNMILSLTIHQWPLLETRHRTHGPAFPSDMWTHLTFLGNAEIYYKNGQIQHAESEVHSSQGCTRDILKQNKIETSQCYHASKILLGSSNSLSNIDPKRHLENHHNEKTASAVGSTTVHGKLFQQQVSFMTGWFCLIVSWSKLPVIRFSYSFAWQMEELPDVLCTANSQVLPSHPFIYLQKRPSSLILSQKVMFLILNCIRLLHP